MAIFRKVSQSTKSHTGSVNMTMRSLYFCGLPSHHTQIKKKTLQGCVRTGDSHYELAADKSAAIMQCSLMETSSKNLKRMFPPPCGIDVAKAFSESEEDFIEY